jgi:FMN phosphatase YigB (HAD superfamily)
MIVFDINGTLLERVHKNDTHTINEYEKSGLKHDHELNSHYIYLRSHLDTLIKFLHTHNLKYMFWSTCHKSNVEILGAFLRDLGFNKCMALYSYDECSIGENKGNSKPKKCTKDLRRVSKAFDIPLERCILVDDSAWKGAEGCNFVGVSEFDPLNEDSELLRICSEFHEYYGGCDSIECLKNFK